MRKSGLSRSVYRECKLTRQSILKSVTSFGDKFDVSCHLRDLSADLPVHVAELTLRMDALILSHTGPFALTSHPSRNTMILMYFPLRTHPPSRPVTGHAYLPCFVQYGKVAPVTMSVTA